MAKLLERLDHVEKASINLEDEEDLEGGDKANNETGDEDYKAVTLNFEAKNKEDKLREADGGTDSEENSPKRV